MRKFLSYLVVLLSVCVAMVLFANSSTCLAYSYNESIFDLTKTQIDANLDMLVEKNAIPQSMATYVKNSYSSVSSSFVGYFIMKTTNYYYFTWFLTGNGTTITNKSNDKNNTLYNMWRGCSSGLRFNLNGNFNSAGNFPYNTQTIEYCFSTIPINTRSLVMTERGEYGNNYFVSFDMSFTHGYSDDLNYNGEAVQAVKLNYNNTRVFIETVIGYEEATNIKAKLDNFNLDFVDYAGTGQIAKYQLLSRLNYNQPYNLVVSCIYDGEPQQISETIVFIPDGTIIENGSITYYPSGDGFNTQNATNTILNYLNASGDVEGQFDDIFSGDSMTIANNLSYPNIPYTNYWMPIYNFAVGICDTLQASGDVYFDIPIRGTAEVKRVYSSSFTTPDYPLFQFVAATLVFGVVFELYVQFKDFIYFLNTANFHEAIKQLDSEENQLWRM